MVQEEQIPCREIEEDEQAQPQPDHRTIDDAIERFLDEVKAVKGAATLKAYKRDLRWFRKHCSKHHVSRLFRDDAMALFAAGREERSNQKTINRRVIVMLCAMRGTLLQGSELPSYAWMKRISARCFTCGTPRASPATQSGSKVGEAFSSEGLAVTTAFAILVNDRASLTGDEKPVASMCYELLSGYADRRNCAAGFRGYPEPRQRFLMNAMPELLQ